MDLESKGLGRINITEANNYDFGKLLADFKASGLIITPESTSTGTDKIFILKENEQKVGSFTIKADNETAYVLATDATKKLVAEGNTITFANRNAQPQEIIPDAKFGVNSTTNFR